MPNIVPNIVVDWNSHLYRQFEDERTRPARDLLARIDLETASLAVDLGCGPGNSTELLVTRFPQATVIGLDTSEDMLKSARARLPGCRFEKADIAAWHPGKSPDLIYANASLQWVGDHERLMPRLFSELAPGGVLAFQMPDNREEPSHRLMRETAAEGPWSQIIGDAAAVRLKVLPLAAYYDMLAPGAAAIEIWRTTYHHPMPSAAAIVNWVRGTGLRPFIDPLSEAQQAAFLSDYEKRIGQAYPPHPDGRLILAFPRIFLVARRKT